jgi:hypothetical protein
MSAALLASLLAAALGAAPVVTPLDTPQPARPRLPGVGRVAQVTGARAYLDAGADDGLAVGDVLALWRGEAESGHCTVEAVAPGSATCKGEGLRPGDAFKLRPLVTAAEKVVALPTVPSDEELARRAAAVAATPVSLVAWKPTGPATPALASPRNNVAEVSLADAYWSSTGSGTWDVVRLDATVHGAVAGPFTLDVDLRAERWLERGASTFRPDDDSRLYLWQAQLGWGSQDGRLNMAAGRVLPWTIPGATVMDGALVGVRRQGWEVGAFGGLVPEPDTTAPTTTRATAGGFWSLEQRYGQTVQLRQEGRLAWVRSPELGDRLELEADAALHAGAALDLFGSARMAAGGTVTAPGGLDEARLELGLRPLPGLWVNGGFEYGGLAVPWVVAPPAFGSRGTRADGSVSYDLGPARVGVSGGMSRDAVSNLERTWVGPEVQLPRLFSPRVSLSAGYLEELGWLHGQSAWVQTVARPWDALRLIARASWSHEASLAMDQETLGLSIAAAAELTRRIGLRLSVLGQTGLSAGGEGASSLLGLNAALSVYALF